MTRINNVTKNVMSDEWYTPIDVVKKCFELLSLDQALCVMCPFDDEKSNFVRYAQQIGHQVIFGINNYLEADYKYDAVVTNPPFSIKDKVIERVLQSGKPSALLMPLDSLGGVARRKMFRQYGYPSIYVPIKRVSLINEAGLICKHANFHSIIMLLNWKTTPQIIYERWEP
jgi:hypothetical protein